jgi:peptidyl-prolyl cis-trans isomerase D
MVMTSLRDSASGGVGKFILFGFLVLAAGGLVFSDVGGFFRGGVSGSDVAKVGDKTISIQQFDNTLRRTIARLNITPEQAYQFGYTQQILNSEIRGELMAAAASENDIRIGKKKIAEEIKKIVTPMAQDGQSAEDVLNQLLVAQNMSERQLVADIRKDISINLLNTGLQNGFADISTAMAKDLSTFENETRAIQYVLFKDEDVEMTTPPTDEELQQLYDATKEAYAVQEKRQAQVVTINTADLEKTLDISEEEVRAEYDANIDSYKFEESRSVEQTILRTEEDAKKVFDKVQGGASLKNAVKAVTGNTTDYIPAQPVTKANILEDLSEAVFAAKKGDAVGPIKSALGHHVLVLSDLKPAYTQSFDDAKDEIRKELTATRLIDTKFELANTVDDMLASGATPEDLKEEVDVDIKTLAAVDRTGNTSDGKNAFAGMEADKATMLESIFELNEGESSAVFEMANRDTKKLSSIR